MSDIFREVDEEIRKERYHALWKKYGPWVIAAAVGLVLVVAGYQGWKQWQRSQELEASKTYAEAVAALDAGNTQAALQQLSGLADPRANGYGLLAAFRQAELQAEQGDVGTAIQTWDRIAASAEAPQALSDLATLFSVMHQVDGGEPQQLASRLQPVADGNRALRWSAIELQAYLAHKQGDDARAVELYGQIADASEVPPAQRQRATQMLALLKG